MISFKLSKNKEDFMSYWINSSNDLIKRLLLKGDNKIKIELEELIEEKSISKIIDDNIVMSEVEDLNENIWSFLTLRGDLKAVKIEVIIRKIKLPKDISKLGLIIY